MVAGSLPTARSAITPLANEGGGIFANGGVQIGNTILKTGASGANIAGNPGSVTSLGYNLSSDDGGGFLTGTGDQINTDPVLGPLQENSGPTFTHAPQRQSSHRRGRSRLYSAAL